MSFRSNYNKRSYNRRNYGYRNKSYSKSFKSAMPYKRQETKVMDEGATIWFEADTVLDSNQGFSTDFTRLRGCDQGTSIRQRVGNKIKLKNVNFKFVLTAAGVKGTDAEVTPAMLMDNSTTSATGATYRAGYEVPAEIINGPNGPANTRTWIQQNGNDGWVTRDDDTGTGTATYNAVTIRSAASTSTSEDSATKHNYINNWKYIRSIFRIMVIRDRQQQEDKETISRGEVLEPFHLKSTLEPWNNTRPSVLSNLNAANFGRYQILYDKNFTCDGDDPTKIVTFNIKTHNVQSYKGPGYASVRQGSLYYAIFELSPDTGIVASHTMCEAVMSARTTYTDC